MCTEDINLWNWCTEHQIQTLAVYHTGVQNVTADRLSRYFSQDSEWVLDSQILHGICQRWGLPKVDLFVTSSNRKCSLLCLRGWVGHLSLRHLSPSLHKGPVLHMPSNTSNSKSDEQDQAGQDQDYPHSTDLAKASLVSLPALLICPIGAQAFDSHSSSLQGCGSCSSPWHGILHLQAWFLYGSWD